MSTDKLIKALRTCGVLCLVVFVNYAHAQDTNSAVPKLSKHQGYLLISLDVGGTAPSLEYAQRHRKKHHRTTIKTIKLAHKEEGFLLLPINKGSYQITAVNAPYYNLPYRYDTDNKKNWQFIIQPQAINYLGKLTISKERSRNHVLVELKNRLATDYEEIHSRYQQTLNVFPLLNAINLRDDFYEDLKK